LKDRPATSDKNTDAVSTLLFVGNIGYPQRCYLGFLHPCSVINGLSMLARSPNYSLG
jgi:hypothetical protein